MTTRTHGIPAALALAGLLATGVAAAQSDTSRQQRLQALQERMAAADTDGDGTYSRAEVEANFPRLAERFDTFDADGDERLSREELRDLAQSVAAARGRR